MSNQEGKAMETKNFKITDYEVVNCERFNPRLSWCSVKVRVMVNGLVKEETAQGDGPVEALHRALCLALSQFSFLGSLDLMGFKVQYPNFKGVASTVKVSAACSNNGLRDRWNAQATSPNIVSAYFETVAKLLDQAITRYNAEHNAAG